MQHGHAAFVDRTVAGRLGAEQVGGAKSCRSSRAGRETEKVTAVRLSGKAGCMTNSKDAMARRGEQKVSAPAGAEGRQGLQGAVTGPGGKRISRGLSFSPTANVPLGVSTERDMRRTPLLLGKLLGAAFAVILFTGRAAEVAPGLSARG
jgi:hypothetical protein